MYCKNCGRPVDPNAVVCVHCGVGTQYGNKFCRSCGNPTPEGTIVCSHCGVAMENMQKSKLVAGLLGIFLGGLGVHNFYLGFNKKAVIQILLSVFLFGTGAIWGLIEGIMILTGNINKDAKGIPLKNDM